jgi:MtN3 and saliva related transmembrane protein
MEKIGFLAAFLTTVSFIPQVVKVVVSKETEALSLWTYILFVIGITLWLVYGLMSRDYPLIFANSITLVLGLIVLKYKLKYG